ncbi:MAG: hypothetical protein RIS56_1562, partial [Verrucomicrobiota bacterium]
AAGEFWVGQGGERRGRPPAVCSARTNAVQAGKTRRPEGLGGKGPLAALLVGHRPLRVCFLLRALPIEPFPPKQNPSSFSDRLLGLWRLTDIPILQPLRLAPASLGRMAIRPHNIAAIIVAIVLIEAIGEGGPLR